MATAAPPATASPPAADLGTAAVQELERRRRSQTRVRWELLAQLVRKDLKVKYQNSTLGFVWSLLNPLFLLAVYGFVFGVVLKSGIPRFPVYLMSGLLAWNVFASAVFAGALSVVGNSGLVKKVRFPMPVLPLSSVGFALVHYVLQLAVFLVVLLVTGQHFWGVHLLLFVPAMVLLLTFTAGMAFLVSALNVRYRDTEHLLELLLFAWFWLTAGIYASGLIHREIHSGLAVRVFFADPPATVVALMHRAFYPIEHATVANNAAVGVLPAPGYTWYLEQFGVAMALSLAVLWLGLSVFRRMQATFAEEL